MKIATNSYKCRGPLTMLTLLVAELWYSPTLPPAAAHRARGRRGPPAMLTLLVAELWYSTHTATGSCPSSTRAPRAPGHDHQLAGERRGTHLDI
ncbi:hypothetical protein ACEU6F_14080 [Aeromonas salmonicida]|uniref:hypothetical protein n=1 Tax=Aeromonas salmonicida TaxID=645 RepID=UPI0035A6ACB4